jgi:hypothetical protein
VKRTVIHPTTSPTELIEAYWARILAVEAFSLRVEASYYSTHPLLGLVGRGKVKGMGVSDGVWDWHEEGCWPEKGGGMAFTNHYRWTRQANALELAHCRNGSASPVVLGCYIIMQDGLIMTEPHVCGQDHYEGTLSRVEEGLRLEWTVRGPSKAEKTVTFYRMRREGLL